MMEQQIKETLNEIYLYLKKLINGINITTEFYRSGQEGKANDLMINIIDGLSWVLEGITATSSVHKEKIDICEMNDYLNEMVNALENSDYVLLCDLLEYEILPSLKEYHEKIMLILGE
jgi:vacuolar-type H+-ATPase subunit D/Vma8